MQSKEQVLERLRVALKLKGRDWKTINSYAASAGHYYDFALSCPRDWSSERKAEAFLTKRAMVDHVSASTQNHDLAALNALYNSQGRQLGNLDAMRAKRPRYERHCPSREEVVALIQSLHDTPDVPARLVALLLYGVGLRVNEALELRLKDVRISESRLIIRAPKHGHDRVVSLPCELHPLLRRQIEHAKRVFELDQARAPALPLQVPHAMARKYPRAPHSLGWAFLFPSPRPMRHPETKIPLRWHLPDWAIQGAFSTACDTAKLLARVTPHCLRHAYGTHFAGDIRDLQAQLGHKSLETTQTYRHPHLPRIRSPLADLAPALAVMPSAA